jgi:uncharacterized membrane protein YpjA
LTAKLPDVFEAKLVFIISINAFMNSCTAENVKAFAVESMVAAERWALVMRAIKCLKGIRWMPWR